MDLPPVPVSAPMTGENGIPSPVWMDWFNKVQTRLGGNIASSLTEIDNLFPITTPNITNLAVTQLKIAPEAVSFSRLLGTDWTNVTLGNGFQKFPTGLYLQWGITGSLGSGTTTTIAFPIAFPTACKQVIPGISGNSASSTAATGHIGTGNYTTTGFDLYNRTSLTFTFNFMAIGF